MFGPQKVRSNDFEHCGETPMEILLEGLNISTVVSAIVLILLMSGLPEPMRQKFNAVFVAGAGAVYINGGFSAWEFVFILIATMLAYKGLESYRFIGIAWICHTLWDVAHHYYGQPIWHGVPTSSAGCAIFDLIFAAWFFVGAPSLVV